MINYREAGVQEPEEGIIEFEVTQEHIDAIRHEFIFYKDVSAIVYCTQSEAVALQIFLMTGKMKPGIYYAPKYTQEWKQRSKKKLKETNDPTE